MTPASSSPKRIGFLLSEPGRAIPDPEDVRLGPHVIDWDEFYEFQQAQADEEAIRDVRFFRSPTATFFRAGHDPAN